MTAILPLLFLFAAISGTAVVLVRDPALLQRPQAHEVTVTVDGQFLIFRPLSRSSLEPFFGR